MIRDPSDGSVRTVQSDTEQSASGLRSPATEPAAMTGDNPVIVSGLPAGSTKPENLARLEKSREWLKDYHAKKSTDAQ